VDLVRERYTVRNRAAGYVRNIGVLYLSIREPRDALGVDIGEGLVVRVDAAGGRILSAEADAPGSTSERLEHPRDLHDGLTAFEELDRVCKRGFEYALELRIRAVAASQPDDLGRGSQAIDQRDEVAVLREDDHSGVPGSRKDGGIIGVGAAYVGYVAAGPFLN